MPTKDQTENRTATSKRAGEAREDGVLGSARERAVEAYDSARDAARRAGDSAAQFNEAPFLALGGGLALGALIAALVPVSRRERELLGPVTDRIKDTATSAAQAAREAGTSRLGELGLTRDRGNDLIREIVDGATDALRTSARAAASTVRGE